MDLQDSGDELMPTNIRIPLTRRTCRTGHQPGFSRPPFMVVRRAEGRCGQRDLTSPQMQHGKTLYLSMQPPPKSGVLLCAKHNHLAPHSRLFCSLILVHTRKGFVSLGACASRSPSISDAARVPGRERLR